MAGPRPTWAGRALVLMLLWAVPGLVGVGQYLAFGAYQDLDTDLGAALLAYVVPWQVWALATPAVVLLGRRLPIVHRRWWMHLPVHLALEAVIAVAYVSAQTLCGRAAGLEPYVSYPVLELIPTLAIKSVVVQSILYWGVVAADRGLAYQRRYRAAELHRAQLEARLVEAQLDALRGQLRPHFLFNTLNAITTLVRKGDGAAGVRMLTGLAELLRRSLSSLTVERSRLSEELDFLAHYLDIQRVRFPDRLRIELDVEPAALAAQVPSLLLQPLVENAIDHGVAPRAAGGRITLTARVVAAHLHLTLRDDGVGLASDHREGIGLTHVRRRLTQRYPARHDFTIAATPGGGTTVTLVLPFEPEPPP